LTGGRDRGDDGDRSAFSEAMKGVKPLAGRDNVKPPPQPRAPAAVRAAPPEAPVQFEVTHTGERMEGRAPGIDRKHLRRLRSGAVPVDVRVDLHGLRGAGAREAVREALNAAFEAEQRCALVIHGRGRRSEGDPVLKRALPGWLAEPPLGAQVMAFASATPKDGGAGATYVLLRRRTAERARV
jgi:DNA-nicking Smr family endonuclease